MLPRYYNEVKDLISDDKVFIIYGSRRFGKTNRIVSSNKLKKCHCNDNIYVNYVNIMTKFVFL